MNKKYLLLGLVLILFSSFIIASQEESIDLTSGAFNQTRQEPEFIHLELVDNDLVAYYPFKVDHASSSSITYDYSNNDFDGTVTNGTFVNESYSFNGLDSQISAGDFNRDMGTTSFWFKHTENIDSTRSGISTMAWDASPFFFVGLGSFTGDLTDEIVTITEDSGGSTRRGWCNGSFTITNDWHHLVILWNGTGYEIWYDNERKDNCQSGTPAANFVDDFYIGSRGGIGEEFNGSFREVRVYNRTLTSTEIEEIYNSSVETYYSIGQHFSDVIQLNDTYNKINVSAFTDIPSGTSINVMIGYNSTGNGSFEFTDTQALSAGNNLITFSIPESTTWIQVKQEYSTTNNSKTSSKLSENITLHLEAAEAVFDGLVINMTFDDTTNLTRDFALNGTYDQNSVNQLNSTYCKWFSCMNTSSTGDSNIINGTTTYSFADGIAISFWLYIDELADGSPQMGYLDIGPNSPNQKSLDEGGFGLRTTFDTQGGQIQDAISDDTPAQTWWHFFVQYNTTHRTVWRNGAVDESTAYAFGDINYSVGEIVNIGKGNGQYLRGRMDSLLVWNRSNFTTTDVQTIYNAEADGTPPITDVFIEYIKYNMSQQGFNWSHENNTLNMTGTFDINVGIKNQGINTTELFYCNITLNDGSTAEQFNLTLGPTTTIDYQINWTKQRGFFIGNVTCAIEDDDTTNNQAPIYLPFMERPFIFFNKTEWDESIRSFCFNTSNSPAYSACNRFLTVSSEVFQAAWDCDNVDPRGKKGTENAWGCVINNWDMTKTQCGRALNYTIGWGGVSPTSCTDVQALTEVVHVAYTFDLMFPRLNQSTYDTVTKNYHDMCQEISKINNIEPWQTDPNRIISDNGKGFGAGMGLFCAGLVGAYSGNPTMMVELDDDYNTYSLIYDPFENTGSWLSRDLSMLRGRKNDTWANYQEGPFYKYYSEHKAVQNLYFAKRWGLVPYYDDMSNDMCSMGTEQITQTLDYTYNGITLRDDDDRDFRVIQRGDSHSYSGIGGSLNLWSQVTYYAYLCDIPYVKNALYWMRKKASGLAQLDARFQVDDIFMEYRIQQEQGVTQLEPKETFPKFMFDNANDIITYRTNYTYENDTIFQIDGGEERGGGHSMYQGYYLYALGETFLDYNQVPYNDDTRMDVWGNGISLKNITQTVEGTGGIFNSAIGEYGYNIYYGMQDGPKGVYPTTYPNFRIFNKTYGGDVEHYIGSNTTEFMGAYAYRPFFNISEPVREYYIVYGPLMLKRTVVTNSSESGIFHRFLNIGEEFDYVTSTNSITYNRTHNGLNNVYLSINLTYTNESTVIGGNTTGLQYCFAKTSCSSSDRGGGKYRSLYYYTPSTSWDFVLAHHWYKDGEAQAVTAVGGDDKGVFQGSNVLLFDYNGDNRIVSGVFNATGWGLVYNNDVNESGAFNTTYMRIDGFTFFNSSAPMSVFFNRNKQQDKIIMTANTFQDDDDDGYDTAQTILVTINASELTNDTAPFNITKNGELIPITFQENQIVTFSVTTDQNSDVYEIYAFNESGETPTTTSTTTTSTTTTTAATTTTTTLATNITNLFNKDNCEQGLDTMAQIGKFMPLVIIASILLIIFVAYIFISNGGIAETHIQTSGMAVTALILLFGVALVALLFVVNLIINATSSAC